VTSYARRLSLPTLLALGLLGALVVGPARAAAPTFGTPTATAPLNGTAVFSTTFTADSAPARVELLLDFPGVPATSVIEAQVSGGGGSFSAQATYDGHILPNSLLSYRFRLTDASGAQVVGPSAQLLTVDDRFNWQTVSGQVVNLHWYGADASFGQRALAIGEQAISQASNLLGVTENQPIDFYIYADEQAFYDALGPGVRENVAGTAIPEIRTMFGYILPSQISQDWVSILITHELTHLVFDTATHNLYHPAPHWLNEGIATYLSEGVSARWQAALADGESSGTLIPLQGMEATFGAGDTRFQLGYAESVSAVDYFVRTYGDQQLWTLVRSYSQGLSDDDAFRQAIGLDVAGFNAAWMQSLGVPVPAALGPQPGPTGPLPPDWLGLPPATPGPTGEQTPSPTGEQSGSPTQPTPQPTATGGSATPAGGEPIDLLLLAVVLIVVIGVLIVIRLARSPSAPSPPPPPPPDNWPGPPNWPPPGGPPPPPGSWPAG
jgi:hypothetical protein